MPGMGGLGSIPVEFYSTISFEVEFAGSGTAGVAPLYSPLLQACNHTELVLNVAVTGTAQAGGSTTSIKLAAGASAVNDYYMGMELAITGGAGNGQKALIIAYDGTSKLATFANPITVATDNTSMYSIGPTILWLPNSAKGKDANSSVTMWFTRSGVRHVMFGARGNAKPAFNNKGTPVLAFEFTGLCGTVTDTPTATINMSLWQEPQAFITGNIKHCNVMGMIKPAITELSLDTANKPEYRNVPNNEWVKTDRGQAMGNFAVEAASVAVYDWIGNYRANLIAQVSVSVGNTAGNVVGFCAKQAKFKEPDYANDGGVVMVKGGLEFIPGSTLNNEYVLFAR